MINELPQVVQNHITSYLATPDLCFFARTSKRSLQAALPLLKQRQQTLLSPPQWRMTGRGNLSIGYTSAALYACGTNAYDQLGLGDTNDRTTFTAIARLPSEIKQRLVLYHQLKTLIALGESNAHDMQPQLKR